jgi:dsRNA-specific ribonuclease
MSLSNIEHNDIRFKNLIQRVLLKANIKEKYVNILLSDENILFFSKAFTNKSAYPELPEYNYEVFEQMGDLTANKFIVNYMYKKFPQLDCPTCVKIVARLRINYGAKQSFYEIANSLGFWDFIRADEETKKNKKKLLEDVFEAFFGVTELILDSVFTIGVGYAICYSILENIFNKKIISLRYEDLYDSKTILKQLFDKGDLKKRFKLNYVDDVNGNYHICTIFKVPIIDDPAHKIIELFSNFISQNSENDPELSLKWDKKQKSIYEQINKMVSNKKINTNTNSIKIGEGRAFLKNDAEQNAAKQALATLKLQGIEPTIPQEYFTYCKFI